MNSKPAYEESLLVPLLPKQAENIYFYKDTERIREEAGRNHLLSYPCGYRLDYSIEFI